MKEELLKQENLAKIIATRILVFLTRTEQETQQEVDKEVYCSPKLYDVLLLVFKKDYDENDKCIKLSMLILKEDNTLNDFKVAFLSAGQRFEYLMYE